MYLLTSTIEKVLDLSQVLTHWLTQDSHVPLEALTESLLIYFEWCNVMCCIVPLFCRQKNKVHNFLWGNVGASQSNQV